MLKPLSVAFRKPSNLFQIIVCIGGISLDAVATNSGLLVVVRALVVIVDHWSPLTGM